MHGGIISSASTVPDTAMVGLLAAVALPNRSAPWPVLIYASSFVAAFTGDYYNRFFSFPSSPSDLYDLSAQVTVALVAVQIASCVRLASFGARIRLLADIVISCWIGWGFVRASGMCSTTSFFR